MQIQYNGGRIVYIDNAVGRDLIARGLASEIIAVKTKHDTSWEICLGTTPQHPPYIRGNCSCKGPTCGDGPNITKKPFYFHSDRGPENVPEGIAARYARMYRQWRAGEEPRPSSVDAAQREIEAKRRGAVRRV